jgi:hypothetical protein
MEHRIGVIALGERRSGQDYGLGDKKLFHEVVGAVAAAIEQDRGQI